MAKQRYINTKFWRDSFIVDLDPTEKLLFIYFLSNPDTNISGVYEIPLKIISADTGIDGDMVKKILGRFEKEGRIKYKDGWISIKNFTLHQSISPKIKIGMITELNNAPDEAVNWVSINPKLEYIRPMQEVSHSNLNSNSNTNLNTNEESNDDKSPSNEKTPYTMILENHYVLYEAKFKRKYNFTGTDGKAINNILKGNYTLYEILNCLKMYFEIDNPFYGQQGYTLQYFQSAIKSLILGKPKTDNVGFEHASIEDGQAEYEKALARGDIE